jgi:hypothetical protein
VRVPICAAGPVLLHLPHLSVAASECRCLCKDKGACCFKEADRDLEQLGAHGVEHDRRPFRRDLQLVHERLDLSRVISP